MTVNEYLRQATRRLKDAGVDSPRLDVLIFLEDVLGVNRAHLLAHPETVLTTQQIAKLNNKITQRTIHVPVAYIRGHASFYGRVFRVTTDVLIPRPESEAMINLLKKITLSKNPRIADIGTGSGCLGITAALELPRAHVELYDTDARALAVARSNARSLHAEVGVKQTNLLNKLDTAAAYDALLANLPYVPDRYSINHAALHEPHHAIFAGTDGMDLYRRFWEQVKALPYPPVHIITEALPPQHEQNDQLARPAGYHCVNTDGLAQLYTLDADC